MNRRVQTIANATRQKLLAHVWPGNVRELRNVIERALILETSEAIQPGSLPDFQLEARLQHGETPRPTGGSLDEMLSNFERELISGTLEQNQHSVTRTAEQLKLSRHALRYRMQRLELANPDGEGEGNPPGTAGEK
jgi:transcriptional regulator with PAS, ATPase and Fis domain